MGELINLRRLKKRAERAAKGKTAAANRVTHGTPKHLRKAAKTENNNAVQKIDAHRLDAEKPR